MSASAGEHSRRAAEYVRMSTDHQKYSTANQSEAIHAHAAIHGMVIVRTYADEGKSGISTHGRHALQQLLADVQAGAADFGTVLVYDVSRWGRFQDADEGGYYEFLCKKAGITVVYCAEQFANDGSPLSTIVKGIKRAMAGEYSRELSVKTFEGQRRIARMGFKIGGAPGYGYRRLLVDQNGVAKGILLSGEQKSISTDRVTLTPGPLEEMATVVWMFESFARGGKTETEIGRALNENGVVNSSGTAWDRKHIRQILQNEKYIGNNVWNRTSKKLGNRQVTNAYDTWCRAEGAFEPLVEKSLFDAAQAIYEERQRRTINGTYRRYSDEALLQHLKSLLAKQVGVSCSLLDLSRGPSANTYQRRFGGLKAAFRIIGFSLKNGEGYQSVTRTGRPCALSDGEMLRRLQQLLRKEGYLSDRIITRNKSMPGPNQYRLRFGSLNRAFELIGFVSDPKRTRPLRPLNERGLPDQAMLEHLRVILRERGRLSRKILEEWPVGPSRGAIENRFGSLGRAFALVGYGHDRYQTRSPRPRNLSDEQMLLALRQLWISGEHLSQAAVASSREVPSPYAYVSRFGSLSRAYDLIGFKVDRHPHKRRATGRHPPSFLE